MSDIPNCDVLWRTDTGHCIVRTLEALPAAAIAVPSEIHIDTRSPSGAMGGGVVLQLSPTPIASTIQIVANFSHSNRPSLVAKESTAPVSNIISSGMTDPKFHSVNGKHTLLLAADSTDSSARVHDDGKDRAHEPVRPDSTNHPTNAHSHHSRSHHGGHAHRHGYFSHSHHSSVDQNVLVHVDHHHHGQSHSVHIASSHPPHAHASRPVTADIESKNETDGAFSHPPHQPRSDNTSLPPHPRRMHSTFLYRWFHQNQDHGSNVASSHNSLDESIKSTSSSDSNSRKHTFLYRLFHHHDHHHHESDDTPCIAHPPRPSDSPHTQRRYALMSKLFHQVNGEDDHVHTPQPGSSGLLSSQASSQTSAAGFGRNKRTNRATHSDQSDDGGSVLSSCSSCHSADGTGEHSPPSATPVPAKSTDDNSKSVLDTPSSHGRRDVLPAMDSHEGTASRRALSLFRQFLLPPKRSSQTSVNGESGFSDHIMGDRYGFAEKVIGRGAGGVVRLFHKIGSSGPNDKLYAVKEFRKRRKNESEKDYIKKLTSEFCISSNLHHVNIVETIDLVQDEKQRWCEIMEYCPGGDLYEVIRNGKMTMIAQVDGRDLKPENLLIDAQGHLKITDFGVSDVFRTCWEKEPHKSKGLCGSEPYIAPEEFTGEPYDARKVDLWSCGIIYYAMVFHGVPWRSATMKDPNYVYFMEHRQDRFEPFLRLIPALAHLMGRFLEPEPSVRITSDEAMEDTFFRSIEVCDETGMDMSRRRHHHFTSAYEATQEHPADVIKISAVIKLESKQGSSSSIEDRSHRKQAGLSIRSGGNGYSRDMSRSPSALLLADPDTPHVNGNSGLEEGPVVASSSGNIH